MLFPPVSFEKKRSRWGSYRLDSLGSGKIRICKGYQLYTQGLNHLRFHRNDSYLSILALPHMDDHFFSLEASYVHQHYSAEVSFLDGKMDNPAISVSLSLRIYFICAEAFLRGKSPIDTDELVLRFSLDQSTFYRAIEPLTRSSLIYEVQPHHLIFPGKDLSGVTLSSLIASLFSYDEEGATAGAVHPLVAQFIQSGSSSFNETSVLDYLNEHRDGESVR